MRDMSQSDLRISQLDSLGDITKKQLAPLEESANPFLCYDFLSALEQSGSVTALTGWQPQHLVIYQSGQLVAFMPLYLKRHSQGEYVFDNQWAAAYQRNHLRYYPKWVTSIPFTPCSGKRMLVHKDVDRRVTYQKITNFLKIKSAESGVSSWHTLFPDRVDMFALKEAGLLIREGVQFQWFNRGYRDFDDYLDTFSARNRKKIKRERRKVYEQGVELIRVNGVDVSELQWQVFFDFYQSTYFKRGMAPYLSLSFFHQLAETMAPKLCLVLAVKDKKYVGAALSFIGRDTFYGRYWGCAEEFNSLHFEACYYQGLDYCLENKLERFDSGAQGEHKIRRGFEPITTYSAHWLNNDAFIRPIEEFIRQENIYLKRYKYVLSNELPFKNGENNNC